MKSAWMIGVVTALSLAAVSLAACGEPAQPLATAQPASGSALVHYSENATDSVSLDANGDLVQRFCQNQSGKLCPGSIAADLKAAGFAGQGPANELGDAFVRIEADKLDGTPDQQSSNEVYVRALYHVALGREPEAGAEAGHSNALKQGLGRTGLVRAFMQSPEFKSLQ